MSHARRCHSGIVVAVTAVAGLVAGARTAIAQGTPATQPPAATAALDSSRAALEKYKDPVLAVRDGYLSTLVCADFPTGGKAGETAFPVGAMGLHLLKLPLVGQPLDPRQPQVLIYEPHGDTLQLVGAEWFVPLEASAQRPELFGRPFDGPMDGHEPIMPASLRHWDLHVWFWRANPAGIFTPTNPAVKCKPSPLRVTMSEMHHH
jgi:hypothetical protein